MGIPITAIALGTTGGGVAGIVAMLISWGGIALVNLVHARRY
jgi:NCAIR mutase (PurE)-related protein